MRPKTPELTREQWSFLAVFEALDQPVKISLAGELVPLPPGPFMELIRISTEQGWLDQIEIDEYRLSENIPETVLNRLKKINRPRELKRLQTLLEQSDLKNLIKPGALTGLLKRSGSMLRAAENEYEAAGRALENSNYPIAAAHMEKTLAILEESQSGDALQVVASMELADIRRRMGSRLNETPELLHRARKTAVRMGDRRSCALIDLRLGRFSFVHDNLADALESLASGLDEVDELGDEDIISQSSEYAGLYYFLQGMHKDAIRFYDRAMVDSQRMNNGIADIFLPLTFGMCAAYLGQFHRAVGVLEYSRKRALDSREPGLASLFESALGIVLLIMGDKRKARDQLLIAEQNSLKFENHQALLIARIGMVHYHFLDKQFERGADLMLESTKQAAQTGHVIRQYIFPFILEDIHAFEKLRGREKIKFDLKTELERILDGPNIHLRGAAYRLKVLQLLEDKGDPNEIRSNLEASRRYLKRSGDPVEQAKTTALAARFELETGATDKAAGTACRALKYLAAYQDIYLPPELLKLAKSKNGLETRIDPKADYLDRFLDVLGEFNPGADLEEMLTRMVAVSTRFHLAERGGLFWFDQTGKNALPLLRASFNLSDHEVVSPDFKIQMGMVLRTYKSNQPVIHQPDAVEKNRAGSTPGSVLCLPVEVQGRIRGVLYHDKNYTRDPFEDLDGETLIRVARQMSSHIERIWEYSRLVEKRARAIVGRRAGPEQSSNEEIIGKSRPVLNLLDQIDQVAGSEANVLILGETGVGKELVARRIHRKSNRGDGPFIIADLTSIPENLVESELFGHEKGAFTGADRQKPGRLELAEGGVLFLDEVGEMPLSVQPKLLRALQEKTFFRVGGTRSIHSDFRVAAATNRNLEEEIAAGRFREDLYYRLNVIPLHVQPLRQRGEDVIILARHFLEFYKRKYNKPFLEFSTEDEKEIKNHQWPGNVRELKNIIERAVLVSDDKVLELYLPQKMKTSPLANPFSDIPDMDELQRRYIRYVLDIAGGRIAGPGGAAEMLGMKRSTLYTRMHKLGMTRD